MMSQQAPQPAPAARLAHHQLLLARTQAQPVHPAVRYAVYAFEIFQQSIPLKVAPKLA